MCELESGSCRRFACYTPLTLRVVIRADYSLSTEMPDVGRLPQQFGRLGIVVSPLHMAIARRSECGVSFAALARANH
jgi:hypothetical protein